MRKNYSKKKSLFLVTIIYIIAVLAAIEVFHLTSYLGILWALFIADAAATVIVWAAGLLLENPSVYDPYWSVAPMIVIPVWIALRGTQLMLPDILLITAVAFWGVRLTANWILGWRGLAHADWRYDMLKEKNPKMWFVTNFFGINMMPTVLVYLAMIPAYFLIQNDAKFSAFTVIGFAVCIIAAMMQMVSDGQMKRHRRDYPGLYIDTGLWKYSRHPNYFGEVLFWWGIFIMAQEQTGSLFMRIIGAVLVTALFIFISIPMMEQHVEQTTPDYDEYKKKVSMLVPWKRKG